MKASALVTGSEGFLGRFVVGFLKASDWDVEGLDRAASGITGTTITADLAASPPGLSRITPGFVIHLAGLAHVAARGVAAGRHFFDVNLEGTRNLLSGLDAARQLPRSLVFASTIAVYGVEHGAGLDEDTPRVATDPYGESKRQAEDLVLDWGERRGVRIGIMRLPLVAGRGAPGNLGVMVAALRRGRYLGVGLGGARRSMVLAGDVARILIRVAETGGVFHLTDGHHPSFRELEGALCEALGRPVPKRLPASAARIAGWVGDGLTGLDVPFPFSSRSYRKMTSTLTFSDEKARRKLGWKPGRVIDAAAEIVA